MPIAFAKSIFTSPGPFLGGTATQTQTNDGSIFTSSTDGNIDVCFVGLDATGRPVFICIGYRTPSSRYVQACRINTSDLTVTAGSVLQLNTYSGGHNDGRMSIAGQSHGGYRFNGSSPVQASASGYLLAMAMAGASSTTNVLYGLKIAEDTLTITVDATETFTGSGGVSCTVDTLDNDTWVIINDKFYQREFTGSGTITNRGDITVPATGTQVQLQSYWNMEGKWKVIGSGSGSNVYCVNVNKRQDSSAGMHIGVVELETDSTAWQFARSFTIEALGYQDPAGVSYYPDFVAASNTKIIAVTSIDRTYPGETIDARVANFTVDVSSPYTGEPTGFNYTTTPSISLGTLNRQNFNSTDLNRLQIFTSYMYRLIPSHRANTYYAVAPLYPGTADGAGFATSRAFTIATITESANAVTHAGFNNVGIPGSNSYGNTLILNFPVAAYDRYILYWGGNAADGTVTAQYAVPIKVL